MARGELSYKYQRLRERLRYLVKSGDFAGKLPGERELARRYAANAKTVNKALNDLAMEGLVLRHVGRGTFVAGDGACAVTVPTTARSFVWLASGRADDPDLDNIFGMTHRLLADKGHHIERCAAELDAAGELSEAALTPRTMRQIDGAVVFSARPSRGFLANLRRRRLAVVLVNNHHEEIRLPAVLCDYAHAAFVLCEQCILLGHRRIQIVMRPQSLPAAAAMECGYRAAMAYYGLPSLSPVFSLPESSWSRLVPADRRATAVICLSGTLGRQVREQVAAGDLSFPTDMSVAVIADPGETVAEAHRFSAYEVDAGRMLTWATELILQGGAQPPAVVIVPGRFVDRGSIVPPLGGNGPLPRPMPEARI